MQRAGRKNRGGSYGQGLPTVAVVGYTNAVRGLIYYIFFLLFLHKIVQTFNSSLLVIGEIYIS